MTWPNQNAVDAYYGNPRGVNGSYSRTWYSANMTSVPVPWKLTMGDVVIKSIPCHKKVAESLARVLNRTWELAGKDQSKIHADGCDCFSGSFNYRAMRGLSKLSMHSYGIAIDFDAPHNPLGDHHGHFTKDSLIVKAFKEEGWTWGGEWPTRPDPMHFQAATV